VTAALAGEEAALEELIPLVYTELQRVARGLLARELRRPLDTTSLVHEAYERLVDNAAVSERGRAYFFAAAAQAMRRVLVDAARRRRRMRHGAGQDRLPLDEVRLEVEGIAGEILELDDVIERLAERFPRHARVVLCRYFAGLDVEETAAALDLAPRTVKRDWAFARAWIIRELATADV
jgi:RNA polymerase sigma factor (TIGR02999 family)